jgi:CRP-like cAMP-binding protein
VTKAQTFRRHESLPGQQNLLWRIESGVVRTFTWEENGQVATLGLWGSGDVVGPDLSQQHPYMMDCVEAVKATPLASDCPPARELLLDCLYRTEALLSILHDVRAQTRLLRFLNWLAERFGDRVEGGRLIRVRLTHQEIAESIGATRVTITRELSELERQGKIRWSERCCILLAPGESD